MGRKSEKKWICVYVTDSQAEINTTLQGKSVKVSAAQSYPTLLQPHGLQPSRFLIHGILQARILEWVFFSHVLLQGIFLTQGSNPGLLQCRQILYHLCH